MEFLDFMRNYKIMCERFSCSECPMKRAFEGTMSIHSARTCDDALRTHSEMAEKVVLDYWNSRYFYKNQELFGRLLQHKPWQYCLEKDCPVKDVAEGHCRQDLPCDTCPWWGKTTEFVNDGTCVPVLHFDKPNVEDGGKEL